MRVLSGLYPRIREYLDLENVRPVFLGVLHLDHVARELHATTPP